MPGVRVRNAQTGQLCSRKRRRRARHHLQARESDGASLGLSEGSGSLPSALPCRAPRLLPLTLWPRVGLCLLQALVAVDGPCVDLGGGVLAEVWGEQSPQQSRRGRSSAWARCFREREPGDSASWPRRLRGACPLGGILLCHSRGLAVPPSPGRWP